MHSFAVPYPHGSALVGPGLQTADRPGQMGRIGDSDRVFSALGELPEVLDGAGLQCITAPDTGQNDVDGRPSVRQRLGRPAENLIDSVPANTVAQPRPSTQAD